MKKGKTKILPRILFVLGAVVLAVYVFLLDEMFAQVLCLVSALCVCALIQRWSVLDEKLEKILGCIGLVLPTVVIPPLSDMPLVSVLAVLMNRFCAWFLGQMGMEMTKEISTGDCLQIIYWIGFWCICGIYALRKWQRNREKVPELKNPDYTEQLGGFVQMMEDHLRLINRATNWNADTFTPIDAEVDATVHGTNKRRFGDLHRCIKAFMDEESVFLVLGDPGSGKSVAMRKLAMDMLKETEKSGIVPVYIDLKQWNRPWSVGSPPAQKDLLEFIQDSLRQIPTLSDIKFLDDYFLSMLNNGRWFFIFDSFDEMPCLLGREEDSGLIQVISDLLCDFLSRKNQRGGVIASRLFRGPRPDRENVVTLRLQPFSDLKINTMLKRYNIHSDSMEKKLFHTRNDLVSLCRNPFSLSLLIDYMKGNVSAELPQNQMRLYDSFLERRLSRCEEQLRENGFRVEHVISAASELALYLQNQPDKGLECTLSDLQNLNDGRDWSRLLPILKEIRLCRFGGSKGTVSFVHRRFQEFFVVKDILDRDQQLSQAEYESIGHNKGFRDALVLYCEVAPEEKARQIAQFCWEQVRSRIDTRSYIGNQGCVELVNTLCFMAEAFRTRLDLLQSFRTEFQTLLEEKLADQTDYYVQHAIVGCMVLMEQESMQRFALRVLELDNRYLSDLVMLNCRAITEKPSGLFETEFTAYFLSLRYNQFFRRFRNTDFTLSQLPHFRYIRNMHRLNMVAELSAMIYCALVVLYMPFIYVLQIGFYPTYASAFRRFLFSAEAALVTAYFLFRALGDPVGWIPCLLAMLSNAEYAYTGAARPVGLLAYLGIPVLIFQSIHMTKSIRCGFRQNHVSSNGALCFIGIVSLIGMEGANFAAERIRWLNYARGRIAPYSVLIGCVFCLGLAFKEPIRYQRDKRWLRKHPVAFEAISRADLAEHVKKLKSAKGVCQYLRLLQENRVKLKGEWPDGVRPWFNKDEVDQLLAALDGADMKDLSRRF